MRPARILCFCFTRTLYILNFVRYFRQNVLWVPFRRFTTRWPLLDVGFLVCARVLLGGTIKMLFLTAELQVKDIC